MNKPLDPMTVERTETPSASYVLRRRYGPARYVITVASWVTVINLLFQPVAALAATTTWSNASGGNTWNTAGNWTDGEPTIAYDAVFPSGKAASITLNAGRVAKTLDFDVTGYTLSVGDLTLGVGTINVDAGTATINSTLAGTSGITKTGAGSIQFGGANLVTGGFAISAGTVVRGTGTAVGLPFGNNALTLSGTGTVALGNGWSPGNYYTREISGTAGTMSFGYASSLALNALNDATFSGTWPEYASGIDPGRGGVQLVKTGPGTQEIQQALQPARDLNSGSLLYRGGVTLGGAAGAFTTTTAGVKALLFYNGTLTIDESSADIDRVPNTSAVWFFGGGGTLRLKGGTAGAVSETLEALYGGDFSEQPYGIRGNFLNVNVQRNGSTTATLTFDSCKMNKAPAYNSTGSMANFAAGGGDTLGTDAFVKFTTGPTPVNNVIPGAFANGKDIATYDNTKGVVPFNAVGGGGVAYVAAASAGANDTAYANANITFGGDKTWNALKIDGSPTIDLDGKTLTIGNASLGLMIVATGGGNAVISNSGTAGRYLTGSDQTYYIDANTTLKVTAPLYTSGYGRVNKGGPGLLWLDPTENWANTSSYDSYGRGIYFGEGAIRMNPNLNGVGAAGRFQNVTMSLNGGVMEIEGGIAYNPTIGQAAGNLRWQSSGGFAAYGTDATFHPNITWNATDHIPDGAALLLNSTTANKKITLSGTLNLGTDSTKMFLREINVATGASADAVAEISGQIISDNAGTATYTYHLVKTGTGTLILSNSNNNYSGATYVKEGKLLVNGTLAAPASSTVSVNPDYSAVTVMNGGTLGGTGTINRKVKVESGGTLKPGLIGDGTLTLQGCSLDGALSVTGNGTICGKVVVSSGPVVIGAAATLSVSGTRPASGDIVLIEMPGVGTVSGTFSGLPEGTTVPVGGKNYKITYVGGDGNNDVVLTYVPVGTVIMVK